MIVFFVFGIDIYVFYLILIFVIGHWFFLKKIYFYRLNNTQIVKEKPHFKMTIKNPIKAKLENQKDFL